MYENDPLGQLVNIILPKLIKRIKTLSEEVEELKLRKDPESLQQQLDELRHDKVALDIRVGMLEKQMENPEPAPAAPATKTRRRTKAKARPPKPDDLTCVNILYANYALKATKGDVDEACAVMPEIGKDKMEYIASMTDEEIDDLYNPDDLINEVIPITFAQRNWKNVEA